VKHFGRLIRAAAGMDRAALGGRPVHVVLVGDGPERAALEAIAAAHPPPGGRVHFAGHRTDLAAIYPAFDVFSLSSDSEQQPVSLLEAMAAGRAVAATDVGDIRATLPEASRTGIVPLGEGDERALAQAYTRLAVDGAARRAEGAANRAHVEAEFSTARMAEAYGALWRAALLR